MKYSSTVRPSRYDEVIGRGMISPLGLATRPRIAAICRSWRRLPRAPELIMTQSGFSCGSAVSISLEISLVALVQISMSSPRRSSAVIRPRWYCLSIRSASSWYAREDLRLARRRDDVAHADRHTGPGGPVETGLLERVQGRRQGDLREALGEVVDDRGELTLADLVVDVAVARRQRLVEEHPAQGGLDEQLARPAPSPPAPPTAGWPAPLSTSMHLVQADLHRRLQVQLAVVERHPRLGVGAEHPALALATLGAGGSGSTGR